MYGLVNKAIEGLVVSEFGASKWQQIKAKAGYHEETFISMISYDDSITYNLVAAASEITKVSSESLLEAFGSYWVKYTAEEGYGDMLKMGGDNFVDFLTNLNDLHQRVGSMMPSLVPPFFETEGLEYNKIKLTYISKRVGLVPMVIGLLKGLVERFDIQNLNIQSMATLHERDEYYTQFILNWK